MGRKKINKIDESQAGFRSGYSTVDNIFTLQSLIQKYLSKPNVRFHVLYVELKKAFDGLIIIINYFLVYSSLLCIQMRCTC